MLVDPPALVATLDADQIAQALWALLQNAAEVAANVDLVIRAETATVRLQVRDNGPGIATADADAIFRPFFTTKATGSGVGLAIARQIFRSHGGDLIFEGREEAATVLEGTVPT